MRKTCELGDADRTFCVMSDLELMSKFPYDKMAPEAKQVIMDRWDRIPLWPEGQFLCHLDHPARQVYLVASGVVEVTSKKGLRYYVGAGSVLGDEAVLAGSTHRYAALARTHCQTISIGGDLIKALARKCESVQSTILCESQQRAAEREDYYALFNRASKPRQVILSILNIARAVQPQIAADSYARFPFEITWLTSKVMMAAQLGMATQKVRQGLSLLMDAGAIDDTWKGLNDRHLQLVLNPGCIEKIEELLSTDRYC